MNVSFDLNGIASPAVEDCPFCGCKAKFGVLPFFGGHYYTRRCQICQKSENLSLPVLTKKVIYLDQFALSNMMKGLDSSRAGKPPRHHGSFFLELFKRLDQLGKLQLVVCPRSAIHVNESMVDRDDYEKTRAVYDQLSIGLKFQHHETIYTQQIHDGLEAWLHGKDTFEINADPSRVISAEVNDWAGWFRVAVNRPATEEVTAELRANRRHLQDRFEPIIARWQREPDKRFEDWYREEIAAHGKALIRCWFEYAQTANAVCKGELPADSFPHWNYAVRLVSQILLRLEAAGVQSAERLAKGREFFASNIFQQIPVVKIGSAMWAGLAHRFNSGQKAWKASIVNDITMVSAHLPSFFRVHNG